MILMVNWKVRSSIGLVDKYGECDLIGVIIEVMMKRVRLKMSEVPFEEQLMVKI